MQFAAYSYLYVEDDPLNQQVMQMIMELAMQVQSLTMFSDSADFMPRLRALPTVPDVILLDIHMYPHDGFALLEMIRQDAAYAQSKVIAVTASLMTQELERMKQHGFDGAIGKPLSLQTFPLLIERILNGESVWDIP